MAYEHGCKEKKRAVVHKMQTATKPCHTTPNRKHTRSECKGKRVAKRTSVQPASESGHRKGSFINSVTQLQAFFRPKFTPLPRRNAKISVFPVNCSSCNARILDEISPIPRVTRYGNERALTLVSTSPNEYQCSSCHGKVLRFGSVCLLPLQRARCTHS